MAQGERWTEAQRAARHQKLVDRNRAGNAGSHLYEDEAWMRDAYEVRKLSIRGVAAEAECSIRTVVRWLRAHGIETRPAGVSDRPKGPDHPGWKGGKPPCPVCGKPQKGRNKRDTCNDCRPRRGEENPNWRGDDIGVVRAHGRVKQLRGFAHEHSCAHCGGVAQEWAYDHGDPNELPSSEGPYSLDPSHYIPLCKSCHRRFDYPYRRRPVA